MKRAENKGSNKLGVMIAALVAVVVIVLDLFSLIHLGEANPLTRLKRQLEQVQRSKKLNMNQVKKKKIT